MGCISVLVPLEVTHGCLPFSLYCTSPSAACQGCVWRVLMLPVVLCSQETHTLPTVVYLGGVLPPSITHGVSTSLPQTSPFIPSYLIVLHHLLVLLLSAIIPLLSDGFPTCTTLIYLYACRKYPSLVVFIPVDYINLAGTGVRVVYCACAPFKVTDNNLWTYCELFWRSAAVAWPDLT